MDKKNKKLEILKRIRSLKDERDFLNHLNEESSYDLVYDCDDWYDDRRIDRIESSISCNDYKISKINEEIWKLKQELEAIEKSEKKEKSLETTIEIAKDY